MSVPYVFDLDTMLSHFLEQDADLTANEIEAAGVRLGRNCFPALVDSLYLEALLTPEVGAVVVPSAWSAVEFPSRALGEDEWRELFAFAGYTVEGVPADRPTEPLLLWRGALPEHRDGWSWTDDPELAQWFADRRHHRGQGRVWTARVEPGRLLARISQVRAGESEHVVDARGMQTSCGLSAD